MDSIFSPDSIWFKIITEGLGLIGIIAAVLSFQCAKHKRLLFLRTVNESFFAVQYFLLGAYTGMAMNLVGCVRNILFSRLVEKGKSTVPYRIFFSVLFFIFSLCTWGGVKSIFVCAAKIISTVAYGSSKTATVRIMVLFTSATWLCYNYLVGSVSGCVCEALTLISVIVGIIRIDMAEKIKKIKA